MSEFKLLKNNFVSRSWIHSLVENTCKEQRHFPKHMRLPGRHLFDVNHINRHKKLVIRQGESSILKPNNLNSLTKYYRRCLKKTILSRAGQINPHKPPQAFKMTSEFEFTS
jgi:hypothetical protein